MLSYRHGFHAGGFVDMQKHIVLLLLLDALCKKDKPFVFLDTHAGAAEYDLASDMALKNREFEGGIARVRACDDPPEAVRRYLQLIGAADPRVRLRWYPGSPLLARRRLRAQDRMLLCELHTTEITRLRTLFGRDRQVTVHHMDGYQALKAFLPPPERRGLVLIDPAYELKGEHMRLVEALGGAWKRWPTGIFAIWHPVRERAETDRWYRKLKQLGVGAMLVTELSVDAGEAPGRLSGTGMIIVNPPWQLDRQLADLLPWLCRAIFADGRGAWRVDWLTQQA